MAMQEVQDEVRCEEMWMGVFYGELYIWIYMDIYGRNMGIYMETNAWKRAKIYMDLISDGYYHNYGKCEINARFKETENGLFDL